MTRSGVPVPRGSPFPVGNLPFGVGRPAGADARPLAAIGDYAVDLRALMRSGLLDGTGIDAAVVETTSLNRLAAAGADVWRAVRIRLAELVTGANAVERLAGALHRRADIDMLLPVDIGDFVDFYSSLHHATNLGRLFRPGSEPLLPNWRHLPVAYHGRAGTIVADSSDIPRPSGLRLVDGVPVDGPTAALDIELEVGFVIGPGSERGVPVSTADAEAHLFGLCLVNDWSARDLQAYEYVPLGPFLGKSFATSMSPWVVGLEALEHVRRPQPIQDPPVAEYLRIDDPWALDLELEVWLQSASMREQQVAPARIAATSFVDMYWTPPQQLAHITANGASLRTGDVFASGTVSGPTQGSEGSLIELTWRGERPIELPDGTSRTFLLDGDRVSLVGWAGAGDDRIGLGAVHGTVTPPRRRPVAGAARRDLTVGLS